MGRSTRHSRLNPHSKQQAQKVNHGSIRHQKGFSTDPRLNFKSKCACLNQLLDGQLTIIRREHLAEWRDGFRLIQLGLVDVELKTDATIYLRAKEVYLIAIKLLESAKGSAREALLKPIREYERKLILALKGNSETYPSRFGMGKDKEFFYNFEDNYGGHKGDSVNMAAKRSKKR